MIQKILIADDIEENLYLLRTLLEGNSYAVVEARNGSEALVKALTEPPDLIITDILMPVIDGFTLCRIWKAEDRLARIPFVFYTATYTDPRDEQLALDMGADAFIIKPTEPDEFLRRVEHVLILGKRGELASPQKPRTENEAILKHYNEALVRKLEHKMRVLEKANQELEAEMSAREKAEKALRESEEQYRSLFENSMDGVLLTEPDGKILNANPEACRMFGRTEDELRRVGRSGVVDINDPRLANALEERARSGRFAAEINCLRKDGTPFPCEVSSVIFRDSEGRVKTSMVIRDITERKIAQEKLVSAFNEKEALLKEIHHRVKNNMQLINSMINLQIETNVKAMTSDEIINFAHGLQNRIKSIALVHEMLYKYDDLSRIDFNEYLQNLIESLLFIHDFETNPIRINREVTSQPIAIATAVPLGMINNELLTNALKHAFPSGRKGEIKISMVIDDDNICSLTVRDNGIGIPDNLNIKTIHTLGIRLVSILVKQLDGSLNFCNDNGAVFTIRFKIK